MTQKCSRDWEETIESGKSTTAVECPFCDAVNYIPSIQAAGGYVPEGYCEHVDEPTLRVGNLGGKTVVFGCSCGWLEAFEGLVWENRRTILSYLSLRAENQILDGQRIFGQVANIEKEGLK